MASTKGSDEQHLKWSGLVESKLRLLVQKLEVLSGINLAHPYTKPFESTYAYDNEEQYKEIFDNYGTHKTEDVLKKYTQITDENREDVSLKDKEKVHITTMYIGLNIAVDEKKKIDIHVPCQDFFNLCRSFQEYEDTEIYSLVIKYVKLYDLPDHVYDESDQRPVKPSKKRKYDKSGKKAKRPKSSSVAVPEGEGSAMGDGSTVSEEPHSVPTAGPKGAEVSVTAGGASN